MAATTGRSSIDGAGAPLFATITDSEHLGIIIIHQELALVPLLSIAENIFLGNEPGAVRRDRLERGAFRRTRELLATVGLKRAAGRR